MFARSCPTHTIARIACKIEHTVFVILKHISANIIFHQGGRPMNAPTEKITNNYKWLQFTKMQLDEVNYYTHFPHSFQQLLKKNGNAC